MTVTIETVNEKHFKELARLRRDFLNSKHLCCLLPLGVNSESEIRNNYGKHPETMQASAVASLPEQGVVGFIQVILHGMPCYDIHRPEKDEAYVYLLTVDPEARGKGVGTALLAWAEDMAKQRGCTFISLEVIHNNPAMKLYERKGYVVQPSSLLWKICCLPLVCCIIGPLNCPSGSPSYWSYGHMYFMKKQLE